MKKEILDILTKTYTNPILRKTTVPLFMSNPGIGKTTITEGFVRDFVETKGKKMVTMVLPNLMPNECVGGVYPNQKKRVWEFFDSEKLTSLNDGDVLFLDEVFNGTLKNTLDAMLNVLGQRRLGSGKPMADAMIVAAANPQGLINLTPQIKERFIRYDLKFNAEEYQQDLKYKYGMPENISSHFCTLIKKEKFEH
ncbi:MAG: AAA family ATPase, partial [Nanoarchaeota archaeon]